MSDTTPSLSLAELRNLLQADPVTRAKYIGHAIDFYESVGVKVTPEILKKFDDDAIQAVTGGGGGGAASTNVIAVF